MAEFLSPGVQQSEVRKGGFAVSSVSPGVTAFVGAAYRGPVNTPTECFSIDEAVEIFGPIQSTSFLMNAVEAFFMNGGERCFINRIAHYSDVSSAATSSLVKAVSTVTNGSSPAATMTAANGGVWANFYKFTYLRVESQVALATTLAAGSATVIPLNTVARVAIGDQLRFVKTTDQRGVVQSIDQVNKTVTLVGAITVPSGGYTGIEPVMLETVNFSIIDKDGVVETTFRDLRMSSLAGTKYIENVVNNYPNVPILVDELALVAAAAVDPRPSSATTAMGATTAGTDGGSIVDVDYVGAAAGKTGLYALDDYDDFLLLAVPGVTAVAVQQGIETYVELREDIFAILETAQGITPTAAITYVKTTGNFASSYEAFYYPWLKALNPLTGGISSYPPSGYVAGVFARTFARRNFGKAPAGIVDGKVNGIAGVDYEVKKASYDALYPARINCIQRKKGKGFCVFGSRTMDPTGEFLQIPTRLTFLVVERVFKSGSEDFNFENNNNTTRAAIKRYMTGVLRQYRKDGILAGSKDSEAFFVICDETNNTASVRAAGKIKCRIGLATENPGEFIENTFERDTRAIDAELADQLA